MLYEFATLSFHPNGTRKATAGTEAPYRAFDQGLSYLHLSRNAKWW
jgi:hypothetical protein